MKQARIETGPESTALSGQIGFGTVRKLFEQPIALDSKRERTIDLAGISHIDSAGLALLVHWAAQASAQGGALRFVNLPAQLEAMARLCDLEPTFGLDETPTKTA